MTYGGRELDDVDVQIKRSRIQWEKEFKDRSKIAGRLSADEVDVITFISSSFQDEDAAADRACYFNEDDGPGNARIFTKVLAKLNDENLVQAVLSLISEVLHEDKSRVQYFSEEKNSDISSPGASHLLDVCFALRSKRLQKEKDRADVADAYTRSKAREVAALLLGSPGHSNARYQEFWGWVLEDIHVGLQQGGAGKGLERGMLALKLALYNKEFQEAFEGYKENCINLLWDVLKGQTDGNSGTGKNRQVIYLTVFCLWMLSFNSDFYVGYWTDLETKSRATEGQAEKLDRSATLEQDRIDSGRKADPIEVALPNGTGRFRWTWGCLMHIGLIKTLIKLLKSRLNPKIVRICLQFFANLVGKRSFNEILVNHRLVPVLEAFKDEKFGDNDPEVKDNTEFLLTGLAQDAKILSSFEKYEKEVQSGILEPGPVHTESFWKRNANKFERDNYALLKQLVSIVRDGVEPETVALACYDLGEFGRFYPEGRRIVETLHGKEFIMNKLQEDSNEEVRKHALLAIQKLLVANWEMIT